MKYIKKIGIADNTCELSDNKIYIFPSREEQKFDSYKI